MSAIFFVGGPSCTQKRSKPFIFFNFSLLARGRTVFELSLVLLIMSLIHVVVLCVLVFNFPSKGLLGKKKLNLECVVVGFFLFCFVFPGRNKIQPNSCLCCEMEVIYLWFSIAHLGYIAELLIMRACKRRYCLANELYMRCFKLLLLL